MKLFRAAVNQSAFLKCGVMGFQGSGKTYTAVEIALGLHKHIRATKPLAFLDSETGSDWAMPRCKTAGVPLEVMKSRAFKDLCSAIREAEEGASILIIDSVTHFWAELMDAYRRDHGMKPDARMGFHHWMPIKQEWHKFSDLFVNSALHIIVCGRAGWEYNYEELEEGEKKELVKTGTRMKAETEFGYESSLLIEMERIRETVKVEGKRQGTVGAGVLHRAHVLKDRRMDSETLDGKSFDNPTFADFLPHIKALNIGGVQVGVDTTRTSEGTFESNGDSWEAQKRARAILCEELQGELEAAYPGTAKQEKQLKAALLKYVFATYSWIKLETLDAEALKSGLGRIRAILAEPGRPDAILADMKSRGKSPESGGESGVPPAPGDSTPTPADSRPAPPVDDDRPFTKDIPF